MCLSFCIKRVKLKRFQLHSGKGHKYLSRNIVRMSRFELALRYWVACLGHHGNRSSTLHKFLNNSTFLGIERTGV